KAHDGHHEEMGALTRRYLDIVRWALSHRKTAMATTAGVVVLTIVFPTEVPPRFIPASCRPQTMLHLELAPGRTAEQTAVMVGRAGLNIAKRQEGVSVYAAIGAGAAGAGPANDATTGDVRKARLTINLVHKDERKLSQQELESVLTTALADLPGVRY